MAAPIDLSGSASLEQQAYSVALELQRLELAVAPESRPDQIQVAFDTEGSTVGIAMSLNTTLTVTNGNAVIAVIPYL
ncbi:hypothetical protein [Pleurocapsa sp. FMAR1]|uniref:hypothetical protein n=1 Tax=Pleurocapsa sp. FMAR1 TaxID=3040204 RepID=UPI0029C63923|nr:hypothetical protein [Pleurocapsa sp. FMAR1]